jgi:hypothetical protein
MSDTNGLTCVLTVDVCGTDEGEILLQYAVPTPEFGEALAEMIKAKYAGDIEGVSCDTIEDLRGLESPQNAFEKIVADIDEMS